MADVQAEICIGEIVCPPHRPATANEAWVFLHEPSIIAVNDWVIVEGERQRVLASVTDIHVVDGPAKTEDNTGRVWHALLSLVGTSDSRRRPPEGTRVRLPTPKEISNFLAEARWIAGEQRVPMGVIGIQDEFAPVYGQLNRLVGPIATSTLIVGAAGSLKSTAGMMLLLGLQQLLSVDGCAIVIVNTKGDDFLYADLPRERWADKLATRVLNKRDRVIYEVLGYPEPPILGKAQVFVPDAHDPAWRSSRPAAFPRTRTYKLSHDSGLRYAFSPTDDDERSTSVITRQCMEEASGPFAHERNIFDLPALVTALEQEFLALSSDHTRWRSQFQATTVSAALRQFRSAVRDLGPLLADERAYVRLPVENLASGGAWVIDVASLPQRAAQAVIDHIVTELWQAKANGLIPHELPLVLLVDELNRWSQNGPTASRLAAIARDQRHRRFSVVGLAQQMSTLHPQLLANYDTLSLGTTRSAELAELVYSHLPEQIRARLARLPPGKRYLDMWPFQQPLLVELPFPSWLQEEGRNVVDIWRQRGMKGEEEALARRD